MYIAVSAFGNSAVAVQHCFIAAHIAGLTGCHYGGDQIQSLDIAVEETGVFQGDELDFLINI